MNLNTVAREVTMAEGIKKSISIAQVKEILRILFKEYTLDNVVKMWLKYNKRR